MLNNLVFYYVRGLHVLMLIGGALLCSIVVVFGLTVPLWAMADDPIVAGFLLIGSALLSPLFAGMDWLRRMVAFDASNDDFDYLPPDLRPPPRD